MKPQAARFGWAALAAAWTVDLLFWQKAPGVSFPIWVALTVAIGLLLARSVKARPSPYSLVLVALSLLFAATIFFRQEAFTVIINCLLCLFTLALLSATFLTGNWVYYKISDFIQAGLQFLLALLVRPIGLFVRKPEPTPSADLEQTPSPSLQAGAPNITLAAATNSGWRGAGQQALPVARGLVIALPILLILGALLASADPIFGQWMSNLFKIFDLNKIPEYLFRLTYILIIAYVLAGSYLHAIQPEKVEKRPQPEERWFSPFLGWIEGVVVLGAVDLMFAVFVAIQFWYLFGGQTNISTAGFTYSEYARRGFNELVIVALLSLGLYLGLGAVTRQESPIRRKVLMGLNVLLVAEVLVILASSLDRLYLYEGAYGFTQLRTYTHILIVWLAILLAVTVGLEVTRRQHHFALAGLLVVFGFGLTFGWMNVDGFIARQNIQRARAGASLDGQYLTMLSDDAVPTLLAEFQRTDQPQAVKDVLGAELACREALRLQSTGAPAWLSYNLSKATAASLLQRNRALWQAYPVSTSNSGIVVRLPSGDEHPCRTAIGLD